jgi:hypothetical protein
MSPNGRGPGGKTSPSNNLYTVILALALLAVVTTAAFVAFRCYLHYGTILAVQ